MAISVKDLQKLCEEIDNNLDFASDRFELDSKDNINIEVKDIKLDDVYIYDDILEFEIDMNVLYTAEIGLISREIFNKITTSNIGIDTEQSNMENVDDFYNALESNLALHQGYYDIVLGNIIVTIDYNIEMDDNTIIATLKRGHETFKRSFARISDSQTQDVYDVYQNIAEQYNITIKDYETFNDELQDLRELDAHDKFITETSAISADDLDISDRFAPYTCSVEIGE